MDAAMTDLPEPVAELATVLAAMPGAVAVALGGSRALGIRCESWIAVMQHVGKKRYGFW